MRPDSAIRGGVAGILATIAMSLPMLAARRSGLIDRQPPEEITDRLASSASAPLEGSGLTFGTAVAHIGFGALAGILYGSITRHLGVGRTGAWLGPAYGLLIWALGYRGILPRLGLIRTTDEAGGARDGVMLFAHLVFGAVLGRSTAG
jgi:Family of unknown function (DUF6789)